MDRCLVRNGKVTLGVVGRGMRAESVLGPEKKEKGGGVEERKRKE
jgi:hypothetical protein